METKLIWSKKYEIGDFEIDAQHKIFLKIIKKIHDTYNITNDKEYVIRLVKELYKYVDFHFVSEENFMIQYKYPEYESHKKEHEKLLYKLTDIASSFQTEFIDFNELMNFLLDWFKNHTSGLNKELGVHLINIKKDECTKIVSLSPL